MCIRDRFETNVPANFATKQKIVKISPAQIKLGKKFMICSTKDFTGPVSESIPSVSRTAGKISSKIKLNAAIGNVLVNVPG